MTRADRIKKQEEHKERIDYQKSLIWAMHDSGYDVSEIAEHLNISKLTVKINLGQVQIVTNSI